MGQIFEEIEVEDQRVKVKIDTGSDFPLSLKKELIEKLKLVRHPTAKALIISEERGLVESPAYIARVKVRGCEIPPTVVVEATGENILGHPIMQLLKAKVDEEKEKLIIERCPEFFFGEFRGKIID